MRIYTRTGDAGETALFGGGRVAKDHPRVDAYGTVDELNACLGWALTVVRGAEVRKRLRRVQHDLFAVGALLATPPPEEGRPTPKGLPEPPLARVLEMEAWMDEAEGRLPALRAFILPGGSPGAAALHVARTVCRRAERAVVHLASREAVHDGTLTYLNRLSDLLFTFARLDNLEEGATDVEWRKEPPD
jgi:cob(I)alamin adenosyltransferase